MLHRVTFWTIPNLLKTTRVAGWNRPGKTLFEKRSTNEHAK